jgi:GntR family transcriptional regulator, carbon starvation induced regulator
MCHSNGMNEIGQPRAEGETLGGLALAKLRADIVSARLPPGDRLRFNELKSRYGYGIGPLREALSHLVADGFVRLQKQRGYSVAPLSDDDLRDVAAMRQYIDVLALRKSIESGDLDWEAKVVASFHRLSKINIRSKDSKNNLNDVWEAEHRVFHHSLISACGSPLLIQYHRNLFDMSERYRRISFSAAPDERDVVREHQRIMEAALARDTDRACQLLEKHIALTATMVARWSRSASDGNSGVHSQTRRGPSSRSAMKEKNK